MRLISAGFGSWPLDDGVSRSLSPSRMSLQSFTHSLQMYTDGPETRRATSSWPRPQNEQRIGCGVAMRFFMGSGVLESGVRLRGRGTRGTHPKGWVEPGPGREGSASLLDDLVHQAVRLRFFGGQPVIAVRVLGDLVDGFARVLGEDLVELIARLEHFAGGDLHVRGLPGRAAQHLVDHH